MIFIAMGADGHGTDPLSSLQFTIEGMVRAVCNVRCAYPETPILLGGAGGYQPDTITPEVWACMAVAAATPVDPSDTYWLSARGEIDYLDDPDEILPCELTKHFEQHTHLFAPDQSNEAHEAEQSVWIGPMDPENKS
jgi:hypothetical protein